MLMDKYREEKGKNKKIRKINGFAGLVIKSFTRDHSWLKISHVGLISIVYFQDLSIVFSFLL